MKKLYRSETNSMLAGVCGGLGDYFGVDATLIRLGWVLISLMGPGSSPTSSPRSSSPKRAK